MPSMPTKRTPNVEEPITEPVIEPVYEEEPVQPASDEDTITFKRSHFYSVLTVLAFASGVLLGYVVWGMGATVNVSAAAQNPQTAAQAGGPVVEAPVATTTPQYVRYDVPSAGFHTLGPDDAPVTMIEFSDYECPFCRRWQQEVYQPLLAAYPGKIKLVYRNLPLTSIHPDAFPAAEAAMCAGDQNAYWQYHDKLFSSETLGTEVYKQYAQDLGLDMIAFDDCITNHKFQQAIQTDSDFAVNLGVRSTPTFFVNGLAIVGAQPLEVFKQVIDKELAGEIPK
jgi:protein-disulfide isomerase